MCSEMLRADAGSGGYKNGKREWRCCESGRNGKVQEVSRRCKEISHV